MQTFDPKHQFWREADMLDQTRVQRPDRQARVKGHALDTSVMAYRQGHDLILVPPLMAEKIRNYSDGGDWGVRFA